MALLLFVSEGTEASCALNNVEMDRKREAEAMAMVEEEELILKGNKKTEFSPLSVQEEDKGDDMKVKVQSKLCIAILCNCIVIQGL